MVKILDNKNDRVIGAHIFAPNASEIVAEISMAMAKRLKLQDIASSVHTLKGRHTVCEHYG